MWAIYNYDNYPTINVILNGVIENDNEFNIFIEEWLKLFNHGKDFDFYFDTTNCGLINIKYSLWMALWIKTFKTKKYTNLKFSKILVANQFILYLLQLIFYIESPIAPVEVIYKNSDNTIISKKFNP